MSRLSTNKKIYPKIILQTPAYPELFTSFLTLSSLIYISDKVQFGDTRR